MGQRLRTSQFQVSSMVPDGDYVYMFGTPTSRYGSVGLARSQGGRASTRRPTSIGGTAAGPDAGRQRRFGALRRSDRRALRPPQRCRRSVGDDLPRPGAQRDHDPYVPHTAGHGRSRRASLTPAHVRSCTAVSCIRGRPGTNCTSHSVSGRPQRQPHARARTEQAESGFLRIPCQSVDFPE